MDWKHPFVFWTDSTQHGMTWPYFIIILSYFCVWILKTANLGTPQGGKRCYNFEPVLYSERKALSHLILRTSHVWPGWLLEFFRELAYVSCLGQDSHGSDSVNMSLDQEFFVYFTK